MFGDQFKMMGVETPVKQERDVKGVVVSSVKVEGEENLVPRHKQEMLLMLASSVGEDSGGGLLSESQHQAPHLARVGEGGLHQAAYNAYDEQEVQVLCRAPLSSLSDRALLSSFSEEELLSSSRLERDNLGFYTEHPTPENHLRDRYTSTTISCRILWSLIIVLSFVDVPCIDHCNCWPLPINVQVGVMKRIQSRASV